MCLSKQCQCELCIHHALFYCIKRKSLSFLLASFYKCSCQNVKSFSYVIQVKRVTHSHFTLSGDIIVALEVRHSTEQQTVKRHGG